jgi:hypothetical protein
MGISVEIFDSRQSGQVKNHCLLNKRRTFAQHLPNEGNVDTANLFDSVAALPQHIFTFNDSIGGKEE